MQGTLADRPAMEPLVFDLTLATVSVANADTKPANTKPSDGHNPAQPAYPRRDSTLRMLDRDRLVQASGGHLSLIGHITQRELAESLHRTEAHNGFANRCLWACVERS